LYAAIDPVTPTTIIGFASGSTEEGSGMLHQCGMPSCTASSIKAAQIRQA
jgi:hypothetical protein